MAMRPFGFLSVGREKRAPARRGNSSPYREIGVSGTPTIGGYVQETDVNAKLRGTARHKTAAETLTNFSIVFASVRYFLDLIAKPSWSFDPADDTPQAREMAEFMEEVVDDMRTNWARIIRRSGMFRYHGFGFGEWTAKRRDDGRIGLLDIEQRPQHTIARWDIEPNGDINGVWQRPPLSGEEIYLPRQKLIYLVDDSMSDSPMGLGWIRGLAEPAERLKTLHELEMIAFERNLAGTPIGRLPYAELEAAVKGGALTEEQMAEMVSAMEDFVDLQKKKPNTSLTLDSMPYEAIKGDGTQFSNVLKWGIDLLTGDMSGIDALANAIDRIKHEMALIMGTESILIGKDGGGSLAMSKDKSQNLYLIVNSTLGDMAEGYSRDIIDPIWTLNGFPDELKPQAVCEDVAFKDVETVASTLRDMAAAGAVLEPDDPAINDVRDLAGISRVPEESIEAQIAARDALRPPPDDPGGGPANGPEDDPLEEDEE